MTKAHAVRSRPIRSIGSQHAPALSSAAVFLSLFQGLMVSMDFMFLAEVTESETEWVRRESECVSDVSVSERRECSTKSKNQTQSCGEHCNPLHSIVAHSID